jgi:UDP-N-acetylglucosamine 2-epimerase
LLKPQEAYDLNTKTENLIPVQLSRVEDQDPAPQSKLAANRKKFVEPEVSFPIDVLEATTFFVLTDSGSTT